MRRVQMGGRRGTDGREGDGRMGMEGWDRGGWIGGGWTGGREGQGLLPFNTVLHQLQGIHQVTSGGCRPKTSPRDSGHMAIHLEL